MKLLSIEDSKGYYLTESGELSPLDQITKEDLLRLVDLVLTTDSEMDEYDAVLLQNQSHRIIYENVWTRLRDLSTRKNEFLDESKRLYLTEYERYKSGTPQSVDNEERDAESTTIDSGPD